MAAGVRLFIADSPGDIQTVVVVWAVPTSDLVMNYSCLCHALFLTYVCYVNWTLGWTSINNREKTPGHDPNDKYHAQFYQIILNMIHGIWNIKIAWFLAVILTAETQVGSSGQIPSG